MVTKQSHYWNHVNRASLDGAYQTSVRSPTMESYNNSSTCSCCDTMGCHGWVLKYCMFLDMVRLIDISTIRLETKSANQFRLASTYYVLKLHINVVRNDALKYVLCMHNKKKYNTNVQLQHVT